VVGRRVEVDEKWWGGEKKKKSWGRVNEYKGEWGNEWE